MRLIILSYLILLAVFAHAAPLSIRATFLAARAAGSSIALGDKVWVKPGEGVPKPKLGNVRTQKSQLNLLSHHPLFLESWGETSRNSN